MRIPSRATHALTLALAVSGAVGACRTSAPATVTASRTARVKPPPDPVYVANCKVVQDSAKRFSDIPVYLTNDVDTEAEMQASDQVPRFDDPTLGPGLVKAFYIVGPTGRAEPLFIRIAHATRPGLETSVRKYLPRAEFKPATIAGIPVRVCVAQEFRFKLG
jgi:hypothetical protein